MVNSFRPTHIVGDESPTGTNAAIDLATGYEVILLTSEGTNVRRKWDEGDGD